MGSEIVVTDDAEIVVMVRWVERHILTVILIQITHVIADNIDHHPDIPLVAGSDKTNKVLLRSEVLIEFINIPAPIAMVASIAVVDDRADPDSIEAHTLDVV